MTTPDVLAATDASDAAGTPGVAGAVDGLDTTSSATGAAVPMQFNITLELTPVLQTAGLTAPWAAGLQFTPLYQIGGGQGRHLVFVGRDHQLNTELAYKRIPKQDLDLTEFFAEAQRLHASRHRHVAPVQYACEDSTHLYVAMPHFVRGSLQSLLETRMLTAREVIRLGLDMLMGLHHAHVRGVLHLDIKPSNVFLDDSGAALLADFGQSTLVDAQGFAAASAMYPTHWPPEVETSSHLTRQADVYQAGLTLYRMCVGNAAWQKQLAALGGNGTSQFADALRRGVFPIRDAFPAHIPKPMRRVVQKALAVNPDERWPSVLALMTALAAVDYEWLDWEAAELANGGMEWRLPGTPARHFELRHDGSGKWQVECWRIGENTQRLNQACLGPCSEGPARTHAYKVLHKR